MSFFVDDGKKILFVVYSLSESNGTERAVVNLANSLVKSKINVTILSLVKQSDKCKFNIDKRIKQDDLGCFDGNKLFVLFLSMFLLLGYLKNRFITHCIGSLVYINFTLVIVRFFCRFKLIACEHIPYEYPAFYVQFLRLLFYKKTDTIVCLNESELMKFNKFFNNVIVSPNIVPASNVFTCLNNNRLLCVSRMSHEKGIDILLDMLKIFYQCESNVKYHVDIVGDGPLLEELVSYSKKLGLDQYLSFLGKQNDVSTFYSKSDFVLVTSRYEGFGLVIAEAMSCGVPVISFDVESGPRHIITNNFNGLLIDKFDTSAYAKYLSEVLNNESILMNMSKNALLSSKRYDDTTILSVWKVILQ